ncbi:MAG: hypothetical protein WA613_16685 [Candidatus Acidiferrales bacterium]
METGGERITPGRDKSQISGQSERVYEEGISHINVRAWLEILKSQMNALPERLKIRTHDICEAADLGGSPDLIDRRFLETPTLPESLHCDSDADLIPKFEAVDNRFRRRVDPQGAATNTMFLYTELEARPRHTNESRLWREYVGRPRFRVDGNPNFAR